MLGERLLLSTCMPMTFLLMRLSFEIILAGKFLGCSGKFDGGAVSMSENAKSWAWVFSFMVSKSETN